MVWAQRWSRLTLIRNKYLNDFPNARTPATKITTLLADMFGYTAQIELDSLELIYANVTTGPKEK